MARGEAAGPAVVRARAEPAQRASGEAELRCAAAEAWARNAAAQRVAELIELCGALDRRATLAESGLVQLAHELAAAGARLSSLCEPAKSPPPFYLEEPDGPLRVTVSERRELAVSLQQGPRAAEGSAGPPGATRATARRDSRRRPASGRGLT